MISKECKLVKLINEGKETYSLNFEGFEEVIDLSETETSKIKVLFDKIISSMIQDGDYYKFNLNDTISEGDTVFKKSSDKYIEHLNTDLHQIFVDYGEQFN